MHVRAFLVITAFTLLSNFCLASEQQDPLKVYESQERDYLVKSCVEKLLGTVDWFVKNDFERNALIVHYVGFPELEGELLPLGALTVNAVLNNIFPYFFSAIYSFDQEDYELKCSFLSYQEADQLNLIGINCGKTASKDELFLLYGSQKSNTEIIFPKQEILKFFDKKTSIKEFSPAFRCDKMST